MTTTTTTTTICRNDLICRENTPVIIEGIYGDVTICDAVRSELLNDSAVKAGSYKSFRIYKDEYGNSLKKLSDSSKLVAAFNISAS